MRNELDIICPSYIHLKYGKLTADNALTSRSFIWTICCLKNNLLQIDHVTVWANNNGYGDIGSVFRITTQNETAARLIFLTRIRNSHLNTPDFVDHTNVKDSTRQMEDINLFSFFQINLLVFSTPITTKNLRNNNSACFTLLDKTPVNYKEIDLL